MPSGVTEYVMRPLALLIVLLASLAAVAPANAKEIQSVTACGVGGDCPTTLDTVFRRRMLDPGPPAGAPKAPAPFYRLTMAIGDGDKIFGRIRTSWVPSAGRLLAEDGRWLAVKPNVGLDLQRLTAGLAALPAAQLPGFPTPVADVAPDRPAPRVTSDARPDGGSTSGERAGRGHVGRRPCEQGAGHGARARR